MGCFASFAMTNESFRMLPIGTAGKSPRIFRNRIPARSQKIFCFGADFLAPELPSAFGLRPWEYPLQDDEDLDALEATVRR
jgi:hypothetical protein